MKFENVEEFNNRWKDKKWEDLNEEEKGFWNELAIDKQSELLFFKKLCEAKKCIMCKWQGQIIIPKPGEARPFWMMFNVKWLVHAKATHGVGIFMGIAKIMGIEVPEFLI